MRASLVGEGSAAGDSADRRLFVFARRGAGGDATKLDGTPSIDSPRAIDAPHPVDATPLDAPPVPADWWDTHWKHRNEIELDNTAVSSELDRFPVLVELTPANFEYGSASVHGDDLRFVATDEAKTPLDYDIDTFTPGGTSVIWVFVPQILAAPAAHTTFWLYSDNANASASASPQNETEYTMVTTAGSAGSIVTVHGVQPI